MVGVVQVLACVDFDVHNNRQIVEELEYNGVAVVPRLALDFAAEPPRRCRHVVPSTALAPVLVVNWVDLMPVVVLEYLYLFLFQLDPPVHQMHPSKKTDFRRVAAAVAAKWEDELEDIRSFSYLQGTPGSQLPL